MRPLYASAALLKSQQAGKQRLETLRNIMSSDLVQEVLLLFSPFSEQLGQMRASTKHMLDY